MCRRTLEHVNNHLSLRFYLLENSQFPSLLVLDFDFDLVLPFTFTFPFTFLKKSLSGSSCNNMKAFLAYAPDLQGYLYQLCFVLVAHLPAYCIGALLICSNHVCQI